MTAVQAPALDAPVVRAPARKAATRKAPVAKVPAKQLAAKKVAAKTTAAKKAPASKAAAKKTARSVKDDAVGKMPGVDVSAILQAVPALQTGQPQPLAAVAKALLDGKLRGKNLTSTKLLKKFPLHFELLPLERPRTVQYRPSEEAS